MFRIPLLFQHFRDHQAKDPLITFSSFLKLHYSGQHPEDNDDNEDNQLPFRHPGNIQHTDIPLVFEKDTGEDPVVYQPAIIAVLHPEGNTCKRSFSIFRPPRYS